MSVKSLDSLQLMQRAEEALKQRVAADPHYTFQEIDEVERCSKQLFARDFPLSEEATERFRYLARFAQFELRPTFLRSHRPIIGPVIVTAKRIAWRVLSALLKDAVRGQQLYNYAVIRNLATLEQNQTRASKT